MMAQLLRDRFMNALTLLRVRIAAASACNLLLPPPFPFWTTKSSSEQRNT